MKKDPFGKPPEIGVNIARGGPNLCESVFVGADWSDKKCLIIGRTKTGNDNDKEECQTSDVAKKIRNKSFYLEITDNGNNSLSFFRSEPGLWYKR